MTTSHRFWVSVGLMLALTLGIWLRPVSASSSLIDSRINQLEFQVRSLQTQINQLQGQSPNTTPASRPELTPLPNDLSLDQQFDNLATLVIEINQRVIKLEEQGTTAAN